MYWNRECGMEYDTVLVFSIVHWTLVNVVYGFMWGESDMYWGDSSWV